jgi:hypothetical protein
MQVALEFLFWKHAAFEGDRTKLSFMEVKNALRDRDFWGESQMCACFTPQDLENLIYEGEVGVSAFSQLLLTIRNIMVKRQTVVAMMDGLMRKATEAIKNVQSDMVNDVVLELLELSKELDSSLLASNVAGVEQFESCVLSKEVVSLVQKGMKWRDDTQSTFSQVITLRETFDVLYGLCFVDDSAAPSSPPFICVLACCTRLRIRKISQDSEGQQAAMKIMAMSTVLKCEACCEKIKSSLCLLDISNSRKHFAALQKVASEFLEHLPLSLLKLRSLSIMEKADEVFTSEPFAFNLKVGSLEVVGEQILDLYYRRWPRNHRESMPFLLLFKIAIDKVLDASLKLIEVSRKTVSEICEPHDARGPVYRSKDASHVEEIQKYFDAFEEELSILTDDVVSATIRARCFDLNEGLWMLQSGFIQLLEGNLDACESRMMQARQNLEKVKLAVHPSFVRVSERRLSQIKHAKDSFEQILVVSRVLARRQLPDKAFSHTRGHFRESLLDRAKTSSQACGGWRLRSDTVSRKLKQVEDEDLLVYGNVVFCDQYGVKFSWAMILTNLDDGSRNLLLNDNPFQTIPAELFHILSETNLVTLDLSGCDLESLPNNVDQLKDLQHLYLQNNNFLRIPTTLGHLCDKLITLGLADNPGLEMPPREILQTGQHGVMQYLQNLLKSGHPQKEVQLIVLGTGTENAETKFVAALLREDDDKFAPPSLAEVGLSLHKWTPKADIANGMSFRITRIGVSVSQANLYEFLLQKHAIYALAWNIQNFEQSVEQSRELNSRIGAIVHQLRDLYMRVPGISIMLVAINDCQVPEMDVELQCQQVQKAVQLLIEEQQAQIDNFVRGGVKPTTAQPMTLFENGMSIVVNCQAGEGVGTCQLQLIRQAASLSSYGDIVPRSFDSLRKRLQSMRCILVHTSWISWDKFSQLATECEACPSASLLARIKAKYFGNCFVSHMHRIHKNGEHCVEVSPSNESDKIGTLKTIEEIETGLLCKLQAVIRKNHDEFHYLKRMRRLLKPRVCDEMLQVTSYLQNSKDLYFPGLETLRQVNRARVKKAEKVEQLILLSEKTKKKPANFQHEKEVSSLKMEIATLKAKIKVFSVSSSRESCKTVFIDISWMIGVVNSLMINNLTKLHKHFLAHKNMGLASALQTLMFSGICRPDLLPFLWETPVGTNQHCSSNLIRCNTFVQTESQDSDVIKVEEVRDHFLRISILLESLELMHKTEEGSYVFAIVTPSHSQTLPASAYCDQNLPFKAHLVYDFLPEGFLYRTVFHCRKKKSQHVHYNSSMASCHNADAAAIISVMKVKDPALVLPTTIVEEGKQAFGENKWKEQEIQRALVRRAHPEDQQHLDAEIEKIFRGFQKNTNDDMGGLELDKNEFEVGLQSLGVKISKEDLEKLFVSADTDGGGTMDIREFKMMVKSLSRQQQYKNLKADQMHVILKCSSDAQRMEFVSLLSDVQASYPGLLRISSIEFSDQEYSEAKQISLIYPDVRSCLSTHIFSIERRENSFFIVNCQKNGSKVIDVESIQGKRLIDVLHPNIKQAFVHEVEVAMQNSLSGMRLTWTCGMHFAIDYPSGERFLAQGMLAKLRNTANTYAIENWKTRYVQLTESGRILFHDSNLESCETWDLDEKCHVKTLVGLRDILLPRSFAPFILHFRDGFSMTFAASSSSEQIHWCNSLESVCRRHVMAVDLVVDRPNVLRVETGIVPSIKYDLKLHHITFCDRSEEPDRKRENDIQNPIVADKCKKANIPKVGIFVIDKNFFDNKEICLSDFESYSSGVFGRVFCLAVLAPGFRFPVDRGGEPNYLKWWPVNKKRVYTFSLACQYFCFDQSLLSRNNSIFRCFILVSNVWLQCYFYTMVD